LDSLKLLLHWIQMSVSCENVLVDVILRT